MQNPLVELVQAWVSFARNDGANADDFCRYFLASRNHDSAAETKEFQRGQLARIIGRIGSAYSVYHRAAIEKMGLPTPDSFYFLNSLYQLGEVKKIGLINYMFAEVTTGMLTIQKLLEGGLVQERPDPDDGRAWLIKLTEKGKKKLASCRENAIRVNEIIFKQLDSEAIAVCISLLSPVERLHSTQAVQLKNKPFDEIYKSVMNG
jgi:DNA-binding MarR family transcriptional regulator